MSGLCLIVGGGNICWVAIIEIRMLYILRNMCG